MKKIQLKKHRTGEPPAPRHTREPKPAKVKPPKGTHRLFWRHTPVMIMGMGMATGWGLFYKFPQLTATSGDRELMAVLYAGLFGLTLLGGGFYTFVRGLKVVKHTNDGRIGGGRWFTTAFGLVVAAAISFVVLRPMVTMTLALWQTSLTLGILVCTYALFVRTTVPYTKEAESPDQPVGTVADLAEIMGVAHEETPLHTPIRENLFSAPEPHPVPPEKERMRFDWKTESLVPAPNGHGG